MSDAKQDIKTSTDLVVMRVLTPATVFGAPSGGLESILEKIEAEVRSNKTDISTPAGRAAVSSLAYKVARSKTALDEMGKDLVADLKSKTNAVDAERRVIRERLDALKEEVRKPLTQWEDADKARIAAHEAALAEVDRTASFLVSEPSVHEIQGRIDYLAELGTRNRVWQEFQQRATQSFGLASTTLSALKATAVRREAEREELARLRRKQIEREQRERDERIAAEAAERARVEAETLARRAAEQEAERVAAEQRRLEQERIKAEERAARAVQERVQAETRAREESERAEALRVEQAARVERDKKAAAALAEQRRVQAIEDERARAAAVAAKEASAAAAREANRKHRARINNEVLAALVAAGLTEDLGKKVIAAIFGGSVPHVKITY